MTRRQAPVYIFRAVRAQFLALADLARHDDRRGSHPPAVPLLIGKDLPMNASARRLFFTNKATIGEDLFGNVIEIEGEFLNGFARSLPFLVVGAWAALMFAAAYLRA